MRTFLTTIAIAFAYLSATSQSLPFVNYTVEEGLSGSQILTVNQDHLGRIWIGTNNKGVTIFDGVNFRSITTEGGLPENTIYDFHLEEDRQLIATLGGLCVASRKDTLVFDTTSGLRNNLIFDIQEFQGRFLLGTGEGLAEYVDGKVRMVETGTALDGTRVFNVHLADDGTVWISTMGAGMFSLKNGKYSQYSPGMGGYDYFYGSHEIDGTMHFFNYNGVYVLGADSLVAKTEFPKERTYYCAVKSNSGAYWIGTERGLIRYEKGHIQEYTMSQGLVSDNIWKTFIDREGNLWFGSMDKGISKLITEEFSHYDKTHGLRESLVNDIWMSEEGTLFMATKDHLAVLPKHGEPQYISHIDTTDVSRQSNCITGTADGRILVGKNGGVLEYSSGQWRHISETRGSHDLKFIYDIHVTRSGRIYLSTLAGMAELANDTIVDRNAAFGLKPQQVFSSFQDSKGRFWLATENGALVSQNGKLTKLDIAQYPSLEGRVRAFEEDPAGRIWIASNHGVTCLKDLKVVKVLDSENGLREDVVYAINYDSEGNLWAGNTSGVEKIEFSDMESLEILRIRHLDPSEGFVGGGVSMNAIQQTQDGRIFFGTSNGVMAYRPELNHYQEITPSIHLQDILLFSEQSDWSEFTTELNKEGLPTALELPYDKNYITFNFLSVHHRNPEAVRYKFMLEGFDQDWTITDKPSAYYPNLPFGRYKLTAYAGVGDRWSEEPVVFEFVIAPPFWRTWWFYSLCALIVLSGIYSYLRIRKSNRVITKANEEINLQKSIIEAKNRDIVDSINYAKRLQNAIMPAPRVVSSTIGDSMILYKPKDIVAGDFFWMESEGDEVWIAAADCTGHGVPGSMVSIVCANALNTAFKELGMRQPGHILDKARDIVIETYTQGGEAVRDGMDIAMVRLNLSTLQVSYSGAQNPIWILRKQIGDTESIISDNERMGTRFKTSTHSGCTLWEIKGDNQPIGIYEKMNAFTTHELQLAKGDTFYLFSDGYADQFGGEQGKKLKYRPFKEILASIQDEPLDEQGTILDRIFEDWKGEYEQVDDVCVIGVRV